MVHDVLSELPSQRHMLRWLDEQEAYARAIGKNDIGYSNARMLLELSGQARVAAASNMVAGRAWNDGPVIALLLACANERHLADALTTQLQRNKAAPKGGQRKSELGFDLMKFDRRVGELRALGRTNPDIGKQLEREFNKEAGYLGKLARSLQKLDERVPAIRHEHPQPTDEEIEARLKNTFPLLKRDLLSLISRR